MEVQAGKIYKHFKNGYVIVLGVAKHFTEQEPYVIYKGLNENKMFCRALSSFTELVKTSSGECARFSIVNEEEVKTLISNEKLTLLRQLINEIN